MTDYGAAVHPLADAVVGALTVVAAPSAVRPGTVDGPAPPPSPMRVHYTGQRAPEPPAPPTPCPDRTAACRWPRRDFAEFDSLPAAVPCTRRHTRRVLAQWQLGALAESAELVVAELATNAIAASWHMERLPPVRLWLLGGTSQAMIVVWDASPLPPVRIQPGDDAESGRGLLLVEAASARWGTHPAPQSGGKAVWAVLDSGEQA